MNSGRSLLSIYFRNYVTKNAELKELTGLTVANSDIEKRQLKISENNFADFEDGVVGFKFDKSTVKNKSEKTYYSEDAQVVYVYIPENVYEDLEDLTNKEFTLILGEDNIAVAVIIEDEAEGKDFLTAYDTVKEKVTVGGTKYTLADDVEVTLNAKDYSDLDTALAALTMIDDVKEIEKKVEATIKLDDDGKVESIELLASAYIDGVSDEALVTKVRETKTAYTIYTTKKNITWNIEDEQDEEIEFPRVYVDGKKADIRDIEAGMVITVVGTDLDAALELDEDSDELKIYATTSSVVEGKAKRVKAANKAITIDGTLYIPSLKVEEGTTVMVTTEELSKNKFNVEFNTDDIADNEITLYINMFNEYAYVSVEEVSSNYTFGVVTYVASSVTWEGDDEEIAVRNIKLLTEDGSKKTYKLKADSTDEDYEADWLEAADIADLAFAKGDFVAVKADADRVITVEDGDELVVINNDGSMTDLLEDDVDAIGDYIVEHTFTGADKEDEELTNANDTFEYGSKTVIFNNHASALEVVSKWKSIFNGTNLRDANTFSILEDDSETEFKYIVVSIDPTLYGSDDAIYAIVEESENKGDKNYIKFVGQDEIEAKDNVGILDEGWLVAYEMSSSKVSKAQQLIDVAGLVDAKDNELVKDYIGTDGSSNSYIDFDLTGVAPTDTRFVNNVLATTKLEAIVLDEVAISSNGKITLKYVGTGADDEKIDSVKLDKDIVKVYDLRNGKVEKVQITDLKSEVEDGEEVYVIAAANADFDEDTDAANVVFIIK